MSLVIIVAKNIEDALKLSRKQKMNLVVERRKLGDFLYDFMDIYLDTTSINYIKGFANSILKLLDNDSVDENKLIEKYNLSLRAIRDFAKNLDRVCDFAIQHNCGLVGLGD